MTYSVGRGESLPDILAVRLNVEMPICDLVYALCHRNYNVRDAVEQIMSRDLKAE